MAVTVLSQASAWNPGADLWILPALTESPWTSKLDWYLNFQLSKASRHESQQVPEYLNSVLAQTEQATYKFSAQSLRPLMISSSELLPNKWVVLLSEKDFSGSEWITQAHSIWTGLQRPSLRIFLPPGQSAGQFQKEWVKHSDFQEFTVVLD